MTHSLIQKAAKVGKFIAVILIAIGMSNNSFAQEGEEPIEPADLVLIRKANNKFIFAEYNKALPMYLELLEKEPKNFTYNFRVGLCYLKSNVNHLKSLKYLEAARKFKSVSDGATSEFYFYLGYAYQIHNKFQKAMEAYELSKTFPNVNDSLIELSLNYVKNAIRLMENPIQVEIKNLGSDVNTEYPEYSPLPLYKTSQLLFTSTRKSSTGGKVAAIGGDYFEDGYICKAKNLNSLNPALDSAVNMGIGINTSANDGPIAIDGSERFVYIYRRSTLWKSNVSANGELGEPYITKFPFLSRNSVGNSIFITKDNKTVYFVDSKPGGFGGKDIYKAVKMDDGKWGPAINLGPTINSQLNEESPFFDEEENTLYFSSQGHKSMGGFDVFKSTISESGNWGWPTNLGYPLNSGADDIFYVYNKEENIGFLSSMRKGGFGNYDIYQFNRVFDFDTKINVSFNDGLNPKTITISVLNEEGNDSINVKLNPNGGIKYASNNTYRVTIPRFDSDTVFDTLVFNTPTSYRAANYLQEINYSKVKNYRDQLIGYKTTVYNVFFDIEEEIESRYLRDKKRLFKRFPAFAMKDTVYSYYSNEDLRLEDEYAMFIRTLKPGFKNLNIYSIVNYIDTTALAALNDSLDKIDSIAKLDAIIKDGNVTQLVKSHDAIVGNKNKHLLTAILFEFAKADFSKHFTEQLDGIVKYLKENKKAKLLITGHTDAKGTAKYNKNLSKVRADKVKAYLISKGISAKRLKVIGKGAKDPIAENVNKDGSDNPKGRALNRRVEFELR